MENKQIQKEAENIASNKKVRNKYADAMAKKIKKPMTKRKKIILYSILVVISISLVYFVWSNVNSDPESFGYTAEANIGTIETSISGFGTTEALSKSELGKKAKGIVSGINVKAGDSVKAGEVLMEIDSSETKKELTLALENLDLVQTQYNQAAKASNNLNIKAPFSGKIIKAENITDGQSISQGTLIATIADDSKMKVNLFFSRAYINDIKIGQASNVSIPASLSNIPGKVESIENIEKISPDGAILFKVTVSMDNPGTLTKDMIATATIKTPSGDAVPSESGKLEYNREEQITAKTAGDVTFKNITEYKKYNNGDTIVSLSGDASELAVKSAKRNLETAQKQVTDINESISQSVITSDVDGIVTVINAKVGDTLVGAGTSIITVANLDKMVVNVNIDELEISKIEVGKPAIVTIEQIDKVHTIKGMVTKLAFEAKTESGQIGSFFPATIEVLNEDRSIKPNMSVSYEIYSEKKENVLVVPTGAITYSDKGAAVFFEGKNPNAIDAPQGTIIPDGHVLLPVVIGSSTENQTEIISGLKEGDKVYVSSNEWDMAMGGNIDMGSVSTIPLG